MTRLPRSLPGIDMLTYLLGAMVVTIVAGLTGRMPMRTTRGARSGSTGNADTVAAAPAASGGRDEPADPSPKDPSRVAMTSRRSLLLAEIVDSLMQGTQFVALTGANGVGKTAVAAAIHEELNQRSVRVRWVDGSGGRGIRLRTIMSQFLGKPEADVDTADVERLFDAMTEREDPDERLALIIDDAEQLLPDAFGYLRLLASVAIERMPQVLFVGDPSFWDIADQAAQAGFTDLIGARFELEALNPEEAGAPTASLEDAPETPTVNALVPTVPRPARGRRIARVAGLALATAGGVGAVAYWAGPAGFDRFRTVGRSGVQSGDAAPIPLPAATTAVASPPVAPAPLAQLDAPASGAAARPLLAPALAAPVGQWPARKAEAHRRATFSGYVTHSTRGTWLFPPGTSGAGG